MTGICSSTVTQNFFPLCCFFKWVLVDNRGLVRPITPQGHSFATSVRDTRSWVSITLGVNLVHLC
jgi:hypothetical protein